MFSLREDFNLQFKFMLIVNQVEKLELTVTKFSFRDGFKKHENYKLVYPQLNSIIIELIIFNG